MGPLARGRLQANAKRRSKSAIDRSGAGRIHSTDLVTSRGVEQEQVSRTR